jgi:DNA-binding transcriptional regulator GbsR (MarR family)
MNIQNLTTKQREELLDKLENHIDNLRASIKFLHDNYQDHKDAAVYTAMIDDTKQKIQDLLDSDEDLRDSCYICTSVCEHSKA